jgi:hypothetical protein
MEWIEKWMKAAHRTFAERFFTFTAAKFIFGTTNRCAIKSSFKNKNILPGLTERKRETQKQTC